MVLMFVCNGDNKLIHVDFLINEYINNDITIRELADKFNIPKSTLHHYFIKFLKLNKDSDTYKEYLKISKEKKNIGQIKGGKTTKLKYMKGK